MFENRVLRKIFGTKIHRGTGEWRKLYSVDYHGLYCTTNKFMVMKRRGMRWDRQVAFKG